MGTALRKLKKDYRGKKLSDGRTIGGAGRLTETLCDDFQNYYGQAIRKNVGDLEGMKNAVKAILHHSMSTDENPMHTFCPKGKNSWCKFQRASALGLTPPAHCTTIPKAVGEVITHSKECWKIWEFRVGSLCQRPCISRTMNAYTMHPRNTLKRESNVENK